MNFLPKLLQALGFIPALVHGIEIAFGNQSGADKKSAALSFLQTAVSVTDDVGKSIVDHRKFEEGLGKVIDGVVECLNASVWATQPDSERSTTCKAGCSACSCAADRRAS